MPDVERKPAALLLLPTPDDEFFMTKGILDHIAAGRAVVVAYLTFGSIYGASSAERVEESDRALRRLGVPTEDIHQLGIEQNIFDGQLHTRLAEAYAAIERLVAGHRIAEICVLAWEGGHQDHDSAHYLGATLARRLPGVELREFPAYTAYRKPAPLFTVMRLIPRAAPADLSPLGLLERIRILAGMRFYRSQRKTFIGLSPGIFTRVLLLGRLQTRRVTGFDYHNKPHAGDLYYERRFGIRFDDLRKAMDALDSRLASAPDR
jgi:LmbE family N-acetylglucosaminyl deacetylase